ncbi:MAG: ABC transporter permease [Planctomycetota bacterium]
MNAAMARALMMDAVFQVLDNRVFRVLVILVLIPILFTFLIGFRESEIVFLFGLERWSYDSILSILPGGNVSTQDMDAQGMVISAFTAIFVDFLGGDLGVMLAIAATAFFVPQMIEKGSADVLFHKPIHRFFLFLSRYFAGLVFIFLLTVVAVTGIYLGLLIVSGYNDPGILWASLTLTYLFGLVHCVSMLVGVMTRSTVASILVTLLFFFGNGCLIQQGWILKEQVMSQQEIADAVERETRANESEDGFVLEDEDESGVFLGIFLRTLNTLHFIFPKTTDAGHLTSLLRGAFEKGNAYEDAESDFIVLKLTGELEEVDAEDSVPPVGSAEELFGEPTYAARDDGVDGRLVIWSRARRRMTVEFAGKERELPERAKTTGDELAQLLQDLLGLDEDAIEIDDDPIGTHGKMQNMGPLFLTVAGRHVIWEEGGRRHHVAFFGTKERFHAIELETPAELDEILRETWTDEILAECGVLNETSQGDWYTNQLGWDSELKYNLFFSIGSSIAFAAGMLLLGGWRLKRIDF